MHHFLGLLTLFAKSGQGRDASRRVASLHTVVLQTFEIVFPNLVNVCKELIKRPKNLGCRFARFKLAYLPENHLICNISQIDLHCLRSLWFVAFVFLYFVDGPLRVGTFWRITPDLFRCDSLWTPMAW